LSIFSCSFLAGPSAQFLYDFATEHPVYGEFGVILQVEPPVVPAAVRAGQRHRDAVIVAALLHPEVGAADRRRAGAVPQAGEPEKVLEQMPVRANAKKPLAHRFKSSHLLDVVRVEVLKLQPVRK
jgi:hypothetical protein